MNYEQLKNIFDDMWILLDAIAQEADDTLWYDGHTTAHERLCDIAIKYDPLLAEELERRLEESCGPGGDS